LLGPEQRPNLRFAVAEGALDAPIGGDDDVAHCRGLLFVEVDEFAEIIDDAIGRRAVARRPPSIAVGPMRWRAMRRSESHRDGDTPNDGAAEKDAQQQGTRDERVAIDDHGDSSAVDDEDDEDDDVGCACSAVVNDVACHARQLDASAPSSSDAVDDEYGCVVSPAGSRKSTITATTAQAVLPQKKRRATGRKNEENDVVGADPNAAARARSVRPAGAS
jgi:hypothetical protein